MQMSTDKQGFEPLYYFVAPYSYGVIDAALDEFFTKMVDLFQATMFRTELSSGSCTYTLNMKPDKPGFLPFVLYVSMVGPELTYIKPQNEGEDAARVTGGIWSWIQGEMAEMQKIAAKTPINTTAEGAQDEQQIFKALGELTRRGGPPPASAEKKHRLIRGWLEAEKCGITQENYCQSTGEVSSSQLRAWMRELKAKGEM